MDREDVATATEARAAEEAAAGEAPPRTARGADGRDPSLVPDAERDFCAYRLLAGGARYRLLLAAIEVGLLPVVAASPRTSAEVSAALGLHPHRTHKFLHLLASFGILNKEIAPGAPVESARYGLGEWGVKLFGRDGSGGWYWKEVLAYQHYVDRMDLAAVLRGAPIHEIVYWPPRTIQAASELEAWMRNTAEGAIVAVEHAVDLDGVGHLLDVGGGDGTMACQFARAHPRLRVTVFNLPHSAALARETIAYWGLADRVSVHEGNFLADEFPRAFDAVLFSRVLTDWSARTCRMLIAKANRALVPGGRFLQCEAFWDGATEDFCVAWEYRYVFYDTFELEVYKPEAVYHRMLQECGFSAPRVTPRDAQSFYSVIEARKEREVES